LANFQPAGMAVAPLKCPPHIGDDCDKTNNPPFMLQTPRLRVSLSSLYPAQITSNVPWDPKRERLKGRIPAPRL
jgi:hypothetical protein